MKTENYQVSKSKGLLALSDLNLSLNELKILDIYLSRIDPRSIRDIENETIEKLHDKKLTKQEIKGIINARDQFIQKAARVTFTKEEYCEILEVSSNKIRNSQIEKYLTHLLASSIVLPTQEGFKVSTLFSTADFDTTNHSITIMCNILSEHIKQLFFDIGNYQYIKYRLKNTIRLTSIYSFKMYLYLLENKFRGTWDLDMDDLRNKIFEIGDIPTYNSYKRIKDNILKKVHEEINEKTNISFEWKPLRVGRKVGKIQLTCQFKDTKEVLNGDFEEMVDKYDENPYPKHSYEAVVWEAEQCFKKTMEKAEKKIIKEYCDLYDSRRVICAIYEATVYEKLSLYYVEEILKTWIKKGYSVEEIENGKR